MSTFFPIMKNHYAFLVLLLSTYTLVYSEHEIILNSHDLSIIDSRIHENIEASGILVNDEKLINYIDSILQNLYDPAKINKRTIRVKILNSPELNAFSLSDGTIYINLPILGLIESESQLALLLSHELAHIEQNHHMALRYELHEKALQAARGQIIGSIFGVNSPGNMIARSALCGFSKTQEYEADSIALTRLLCKGYNTINAKDLFLIMNTWLNPNGAWIDTEYTTHPQLLDRFEKSKQILQSMHATISGVDGKTFYCTLIRPYYGRIVDLLATSNSVNELYSLSLRMISLNANFPEGYYLRGAILEKFNPIDSFVVAYHAFKRAILLDPTYSKSFREIGWLLIKNNQIDSAEFYLRKYLTDNPSASDTALLQTYLRNKP